MPKNLTLSERLSEAGTDKGIDTLFGLLSPVGRWVGQLANWTLPNEIPSVEDVTHAARCGLMPIDMARKVVFAHGQHPAKELWPTRGYYSLSAELADLWDRTWESKLQVPGVGELLFLLERQHPQKDNFEKWLKMNGLYHGWQRELAHYLYHSKTPSPEALVEFAVREAWSEAAGRDFLYDSEYPAEFDYWMTVLGANGDAQRKDAHGNVIPTMLFNDQGQQLAQSATWGRLYWRSHWQPISPMQAYEMFQRLRPGRLERFGPQFAVPDQHGVTLRPFSLSNLETILRIADYAVPFRRQLAAIAYRRPRLVDIDRYYLTGQIDRKEAYELHLDMGYTPADAEMRVNYLVNTLQQKTVTQPRGNPVKAIAQQYQLGLLSKPQSRALMVSSIIGRTVTSDQIEMDEARLAPDVAMALRRADVVLTYTDYDTKAKESKEVLRTTKSRYLRGYLSAMEARTELEASGFLPTAINRYFRSWDRVLQSGRLLLSTAALRKMAEEGVIDTDAAKVYLMNLGWREPELSYHIRSIKYAREIQEAKALKRDAQTAAAAIRAQEALVKATQRAADRERKRLLSQASIAQLTKYYIRGVIAERDFESGLERRGLELPEIERRVLSANVDRLNYRRKNPDATNAPGIPAEDARPDQMP